jgi:hypothetical protein
MYKLDKDSSQTTQRDTKLRRRSDDGKLTIGSFQLQHKDHFKAELAEAETLLDSPFLQFARKYPDKYIRIIGYVCILSELIAMMTPCIALGLQWVTALCDGPALLSIIDLLTQVISCLRSGDCSFSPEKFQHCILKT